MAIQGQKQYLDDRSHRLISQWYLHLIALGRVPETAFQAGRREGYLPHEFEDFFRLHIEES
jgi:hypothetical protein